MGQAQDPQWAPPPQQPMGWGGGGMAPVQRPTGVTLGSIYLIVMGVLFALGGAACGILGGAATQIPDTGGFGGLIGGSLLVIGLIALVLGILQIAAGAGALGGKGWARWTGIIVSVIFVVLGALSILGSVASLSQEGVATGLVFWLIITVLYALTAWVFVQASAFFAARR